MTCQYHKVKTSIIFEGLPQAAKTFNLCFTTLLMGNVETKINTLLNLALFDICYLRF